MERKVRNVINDELIQTTVCIKLLEQYHRNKSEIKL
jgi:hypothetical protein